MSPVWSVMGGVLPSSLFFLRLGHLEEILAETDRPALVDFFGGPEGGTNVRAMYFSSKAVAEFPSSLRGGNWKEIFKALV